MQTVFTADLSRVQIRSIFYTKKFGQRATCPDCGYRHKIWKLSDDRWQCKRCGKKFGLLTATKVNRTSFSLQEIYELLYWFQLELTDHKIARRLDEDYQRIHRFFMRVRERLREYEESSITLLDGEVEVDETYFGADFKNRRKKKRDKLRKQGLVKRGRGAKGLKEAVFGIYERRDGIVYIKPVSDVSKDTLQEIIKGKVTIETIIYSDTWKSYNGLSEEFKDHQVVNHTEHEYKRGKASINGIEGFWGYAKERLLKHHGVGPQNFLDYLKEKEFRFNYRKLNADEFVDKLLEVLLS